MEIGLSLAKSAVGMGNIVTFISCKNCYINFDLTDGALFPTPTVAADRHGSSPGYLYDTMMFDLNRPTRNK